MNIILIVLLYSSFYISNIYGQTYCESQPEVSPDACAAVPPSPEAPCGCACPNVLPPTADCDNTGDNRCTITLTCNPTTIPTQTPTRPPTQIPTQTPTQPTAIPTQIPTQITPAPIVSISISTTGITTGITPSGEPCDCCSGSSSSDSSDSSDGSDSSDSSSNPCSSQCICVSSSESDSESEEIMSLGAFAELNNKGNDMINDNNEGTGNKDIVLNVTDYTFYNLWALCGVVIFINVFILYICWSRNKRNKREKIKYIDNDQARIDIMA